MIFGYLVREALEPFGTAAAGALAVSLPAWRVPPTTPGEGTLYRAREGDRLDWIAWKHYGRSADTVPLVLEANPGLADLGPVLPQGTLLVLPEIPAAPAAELVRLWT